MSSLVYPAGTVQNVHAAEVVEFGFGLSSVVALAVAVAVAITVDDEAPEVTEKDRDSASVAASLMPSGKAKVGAAPAGS